MAKTTKPTSAAIIVASLTKNANGVIRKLESYSIKTADEYKRKAEQVAQLKAWRKEALEKENSIRKPLKEADRAAAALFKPFYDLVDASEAEAKQQMLDYDERQKAKQEKLDAAFNDGKGTISSYTKQSANLTAHATGKAKTKTYKVLEVTDASLLPRQFLIPDEAAIKAALLTGQEVPGAKLVTKTTIAI